MKVLFIGVYRDGTGYGQAAINYILALDAAGVDVACRPLKLNDVKALLPRRILELENKSSSGADYVIQNTLPHQMEFNGHFKKNIAIYFSETSNFKTSVWPQRLNSMSAAWVCNPQMVTAAIESGVSIPMSVVPIPTDIDKFSRPYKKLDQLKQFDGDFIFYTIGEFVRRKNHGALLKAFHTEFDPDEPVRLIIKTGVPGLSTEQAAGKIEEFCNEMKRGMKLHGGKLHNYKREIVITERMTDVDIMRLHESCDCFVAPSYGEAWSIPAFDAMGMGKTPIVTDWAGFPAYLSNAEGWLVPQHEETVFGYNDTFDDLYTSNETWASVDIKRLRQCMRQAYDNSEIRKAKAEAGKKKVGEFSYSVVGGKMERLLNNYEQR